MIFTPEGQSENGDKERLKRNFPSLPAAPVLFVQSTITDTIWKIEFPLFLVSFYNGSCVKRSSLVFRNMMWWCVCERCEPHYNQKRLLGRQGVRGQFVLGHKTIITVDLSAIRDKWVSSVLELYWVMEYNSSYCTSLSLCSVYQGSGGERSVSYAG